MARPKTTKARWPDKIRSHLLLSEAESWEVLVRAGKLRMQRSDFLAECIRYCLRHGIDPREKPKRRQSA